MFFRIDWNWFAFRKPFATLNLYHSTNVCYSVQCRMMEPYPFSKYGSRTQISNWLAGFFYIQNGYQHNLFEMMWYDFYTDKLIKIQSRVNAYTQGSFLHTLKILLLVMQMKNYGISSKSIKWIICFASKWVKARITILKYNQNSLRILHILTFLYQKSKWRTDDILLQ